MRLFFLGTAAAEGYPGIFCDCPACGEARRMGGKNLRFRSALLIDETLLVDFGPDLLAAAFRFNLNLSRVSTGLVTHAHLDHFYTGNFHMRGPAFTGGTPIPTLRLFGPQDVSNMLSAEEGQLDRLRLEVKTVKAFDQWQHAGYTFTAYDAFHAVDHLDALFYSIEDDRSAVLYATDTGIFPDETWRALQGKTFDVVILEETLGTGTYNQHLGFDTFFEQLGRIREAGLLRPGARVIAHHFSHSGNPSHEQLEAIFKPHGVEVAYDGMEIIL